LVSSLPSQETSLTAPPPNHKKTYGHPERALRAKDLNRTFLPTSPSSFGDKINGDAELAVTQAAQAQKLAMKKVKVACYAGYRAQERPTRITLGNQTLDIVEVEDRWYSPGETYFRVRVQGGDRYVLRYIEAQDIWTLEGYRRGR